MTKIKAFLSSRVQEFVDWELKRVSGAIILSDISGFIAMSEALGEKGKEGTEELSRLLNNYFSGMLKIIQKHGGDVIKFCGDSLLVAFYGNPVREIKLMEEDVKSGDIIIEWKPFEVKQIEKKKRFSPRRLISYLPEGVIDLIDKSSFGEHRAVSTVFLNFYGYDEENIEVGALQSLFKETISITEKYGGAVHDIDLYSHGSNIMILFGAPTSHENDAERSVIASMELSRLNIERLRVKVGCCTGFVYAGVIGSDWRKQYAVIGDAVNTAERLMETASPNNLAIVGEATHSLTLARIKYRELESIRVKGKEEPVKRFEPTHKILFGYTDEIKGGLYIFTSMIAREANIHMDEPENVRKEKLEHHIKEIDEDSKLYKKLSFIGSMLFGIRYPGSLYEEVSTNLRFENLCDGIRYYIECQRKPVIVMLDDLQWLGKDAIKIIEYIFRHAMIKDVVYDSILRKRRKELHRMVGEAIENLYEKERLLGVLAYHFTQADEWEKALEYNIKAGKKAARDYYQEDAIQYFLTSAEIGENELPTKREEIYEAYKELGDIYSSVSSYPVARGYYQNAVAVIGTVNKEKLVDLLNGISNTCWRQGNYEEALGTVEEALKISQEIKYKKGIASSINLIGNIHLFQSRYNEALDCYMEALKISREIGDKIVTGGSFGNIGVVHSKQGRYDEAMKCYLEGIEIMEEIGYKRGIASITAEMADTYLSLGLFIYGIENAEKAISIFQEIGAKSEILDAQISLISGYIESGDLKKSKEYIKKAIEIEKETKAKDYIISLRLVTSKVYEREEELSEAIKYVEEALRISKELKRMGDEGEAYIRLCEILKARGEETNRIKEYAEKALVIAQEIKSLPLLWKSYYHLYKATGEKNYLRKTKEHLKEQFKHIPANYMEDFKKYIRNYTKEELE